MNRHALGIHHGILFIATDLAPLFGETGKVVGLSFPEGYGEVSSLDSGSQVVPWLLVG